MTALLLFVHAALGAVLLAFAAASGATQQRAVRAAGALGVLLGLALVVVRSSLSPWRAVAFEPGSAAIAGAAVACAWGLAMALDIGRDRWWVGATVGVGSTALLFVAGSTWTVPALLFAGILGLASALMLARSSRTAWVVVALADAALIVALAGYSLDVESWRLPDDVHGVFAIPFGVSLVLRVGALPRLGIARSIASPAAAFIPLVIGSGFVLMVRLLDRPEPVAAAGALGLACVVALMPVVRRSLDPVTVAAWPVLLGAGIGLASGPAGVPAAVGGVVGSTAIVLWPHALDRGRLSRALVLTCIAPNVLFAALATAASGAFVAATSVSDPLDAAAWAIVSILLPTVLAAGVAFGVVVARTETGGSYHPEAVFMTWLLLAGAVAAGWMLGAGGVYESLGGLPAVGLLIGALACGLFAAVRVRGRARASIGPLAKVTIERPRDLGRWAAGAALVVTVATVAAIAWFTVEGLRLGFL